MDRGVLESYPTVNLKSSQQLTSFNLYYIQQDSVPRATQQGSQFYALEAQGIAFLIKVLFRHREQLLCA